jgi:hypothetical protein
VSDVEYQAGRGYILNLLTSCGPGMRPPFRHLKGIALMLGFEKEHEYYAALCPPVTPTWPRIEATP